MCSSNKIKVALLDRRIGEHGGQKKPYWKVLFGKDWKNNQMFGQENTFAFIDAFAEGNKKGVLCGALEVGEDYNKLKDYDLIYLRIRKPVCGEATIQLREQCPKPVIIGYTDELVNTKINAHLWKSFKWLEATSRYCDVLTSSFPEKYERPKYEALGVKNWRFCPYAGDVKWWNNYYKPLEEKEHEVSGMYHIRSHLEGGYGDQAHTQTFKAMKNLQDKYDVKCRFFLNFDGWKLIPKMEKVANQLGLEVNLTKHTGSHLAFNQLMAKTKVFMEEYQSPAYSRATLVSAAVGTPQVGTDFNTPSNVCFPDTTATHGDWSSWVGSAERLLTDDRFYKDVQQKGINRMEYFYYNQFRERLMKLYEEYER